MHEILDIVKLLLNIWRLGRERQDNRSGFVGPKVDCCAPLIPFLKRLESVEVSGDECKNNDEQETTLIIDENFPSNGSGDEIVSATEAFLRYLEYPEDENINIDLQQAAVVIMSHLDRLASPHQLPLSLEIDFQASKSKQSVLWAGQVSWNIFMDYSINDEGNFGVSNLLGTTLSYYMITNFLFFCPFSGKQQFFHCEIMVSFFIWSFLNLFL